MYLAYWRLQEEPFVDTLEPRYFHATSQHNEGIARLVYMVRQRKGGAVLTGECGTGKTLVCRLFLQRLSQLGSFSVAQLENPLLPDAGIWRDLAQQLTGRSRPDGGAESDYQSVVNFLGERRRQGGHGIVIVEEAQLLAGENRMERIRLLMNLRDEHGRPLLTLVLVGTPNLIRALARNPSLRQRISSVWRLEPLTVEQTRAYVTHRLRVAGGNEWIIDDSAVEALQTYSNGIPRLINQAADMALYLGMVDSAVRVDAGIVERVAADLRRGMDGLEERGGSEC